MRKDAKIGFAIGAVLLAVLVVYAIVVPKKRTASPLGVRVVVPQTLASNNNPSKGVDLVETNKAVTAAPAPQTPVANNSGTPGNATAVASANNPKSGDGVDWGKLVGAIQPMQSSNPTSPADSTQSPAAPANASPAASGSSDVAGAGVSTVADNTPTGSFTPGDDGSGNSSAVAPSASNTSTDASVNVPIHPRRGNLSRARRTTHHSRTSEIASRGDTSGSSYVVASGDTLSGIAVRKYGQAHYYLQILKANPNVNPRKMRPGTHLVLPDLSTAIASARSSSGTINADLESPQTSIRLDANSAAGGGVFTPGNQPDTLFATNDTTSASNIAAGSSGATYTVRPGDSLYRISKRLYGNSRMARDIYAANRDLIGSNMARVRVGMVLSLPAAPAQ